MPHLTIQLDRLALIAATEELLQAEADHMQLAHGLRAEVPDNWTTPLYDSDAGRFFLTVVSQITQAVGWTALHYLARRFYAPLLVSGAEGAKGEKVDVDVYVSSDHRKDCQGTVQWTVTDVAGVKIDAGSVAIDLATGKGRVVHALDLRSAAQKHGRNNLLVAGAKDSQAVRYLQVTKNVHQGFLNSTL